jgi:hypothetical protein
MERCSPEKMKETATAAPTATATALGGSGPWPLLLPWRWCCCGDWSPPQDGCQGGGNFVVPFDLGFLSLYRLSDSRHPDYVFCILGFLEASELRLGRIVRLNPPEKIPYNFVVLSFSVWGRLLAFPRRSLKPVWWGQISGELESNSYKAPFCDFSFIQVIPTHKVEKQELVHSCNH